MRAIFIYILIPCIHLINEGVTFLALVLFWIIVVGLIFRSFSWLFYLVMDPLEDWRVRAGQNRQRKLILAGKHHTYSAEDIETFDLSMRIENCIDRKRWHSFYFWD
jgi:hypothetical protein